MINELDYKQKLNRIGEIMDANPGTTEFEELVKISTEVDEYENKHFPIGRPNKILPNVVDALADYIYCEGFGLKIGSLLKAIQDPLWADGKHCGDCTKEPMACLRCHYEEYLAKANIFYNQYIQPLINKTRIEGYIQGTNDTATEMDNEINAAKTEQRERIKASAKVTERYGSSFAGTAESTGGVINLSEKYYLVPERSFEGNK